MNSQESSHKKDSSESSSSQEDYAERLKRKENFNFEPLFLDDRTTG